MPRFMIVPVLAVSLIGLPMLAGCDREVAHQREVDVRPDGTAVTEEKRVTEDPATGERTVTEETTIDRPQ
jgi:hypothetical protein